MKIDFEVKKWMMFGALTVLLVTLSYIMAATCPPDIVATSTTGSCGSLNTLSYPCVTTTPAQTSASALQVFHILYMILSGLGSVGTFITMCFLYCDD